MDRQTEHLVCLLKILPKHIMQVFNTLYLNCVNQSLGIFSQGLYTFESSDHVKYVIIFTLASIKKNVLSRNVSVQQAPTFTVHVGLPYKEITNWSNEASNGRHR